MLLSERTYQELVAIGQQIVSHRETLAKPRVESLVRGRIDQTTTNVDLLAHLVAESLLKRIDRDLHSSKNIYVEDLDIPQIVMFYRLARAIPFITAGHAVANQAIAYETRTADHMVLLDVGVGKGLQVQGLLNYLEQRPTPPRSLRIVALDPMQDNLDAAKEAIESRARNLPFALHYNGICARLEDVAAKDLEGLVSKGNDVLAINAAFALHHTNHTNHEATRDDLVSMLVGLQPAVMTLAEPHASHDSENLVERIDSAWRHFGALFELIDHSELDAGSRFAIKEKFFGREIRDIFGVADHFRCERHEPVESWLLRLARAGLEPVSLRDVEVDLPRHCHYDVSDGLVRFGFAEVLLVAVMVYRARNGT